MQVRSIRNLVIGGVAALGLATIPAHAAPQVSFGINIGPEPACAYGYYPYAPYGCAPYGYYGPQWFNGGAFVGAGPWFHGPRGFVGPVNHHYDPHYGYRGPYPERGGHFEGGHDFHDFHGNAFHDEHGGEVHGGGFHGGHHGH